MVRGALNRTWTLEESDYATGGPARYMRCAETGGRIGFITPLTHNFCESCNRVRLTCTGMLYMCLGQADSADLRAAVRTGESDEPLLERVALHSARLEFRHPVRDEPFALEAPLPEDLACVVRHLRASR